MKARAPEPGDECCPGGKCEVCNCKPSLCSGCGEELYQPSERSDGAERCDECEAKRQAQIEMEDAAS